jgi:putative FmdB family regulatory protein
MPVKLISKKGGSAMPFYEFECTKCGKTFTVKQSFAQHDRHEKVACPSCKSSKVEQLLSPVMAKTSKKS